MSKNIRTKKTELLPGKHIIGWREIIGLPDLEITAMKAKIDTGARTSALHALDLKTEQHNGEQWVSFRVPHLGEPRSIRHRARVMDERLIKNTSGVPQLRYVIKSTIVIGYRKWLIDISLTDRNEMKHDLILGRTALRRHKLLVAPDKSYLAGKPRSIIRVAP